jgi:hypothetical protein
MDREKQQEAQVATSDTGGDKRHRWRIHYSPQPE